MAILIWLVVSDLPASSNISRKSKVIKGEKNWLSVLTLPVAWWNGLYIGLVFVVITCFGVLWCVPYIETVYNASVQLAGMASGLIFLGAGLGAPLVGWASDRMGKRRPLMRYGALATLLMMILIIYWPNMPFAWMCVSLFALGFFSSAYVLPFAVMREIIPPTAHGTAMAFTNTLCVVIGGLIMQPLVAKTLEWVWHGTVQNGITVYSIHNYQLALSPMIGCLMVAYLLTVLIPETHCQPQYDLALYDEVVEPVIQ